METRFLVEGANRSASRTGAAVVRQVLSNDTSFCTDPAPAPDATFLFVVPIIDNQVPNWLLETTPVICEQSNVHHPACSLVLQDIASC